MYSIINCIDFNVNRVYYISMRHSTYIPKTERSIYITWSIRKLYSGLNNGFRFPSFNKILEYTCEIFRFCFINFRAYFKHFSQRKPTFIINWKLFSRSETTRILIFMNIQSIYLELFVFFITVLYFFRFMTSERNLTTLIKVNRLSLLIESCSACPKLLGSRFLSRCS